MTLNSIQPISLALIKLIDKFFEMLLMSLNIFLNIKKRFKRRHSRIFSLALRFN